MVRKKPEKKCFNHDTFNMVFVKNSCKCTVDDFHCDFGYAYDDNGNCVLDPVINN